MNHPFLWHQALNAEWRNLHLKVLDGYLRDAMDDH